MKIAWECLERCIMLRWCAAGAVSLSTFDPKRGAASSWAGPKVAAFPCSDTRREMCHGWAQGYAVRRQAAWNCHFMCRSELSPCATSRRRRHEQATRSVRPRQITSQVSNNPPNTGVQNRVARTKLFLDTFNMTFKMKKLMNVDSSGALSSVVEHFLHTEGVPGSNPGARTILNKIKGFIAVCPFLKVKVITSSHNRTPNLFFVAEVNQCRDLTAI